jgi:hypothetical protein
MEKPMRKQVLMDEAIKKLRDCEMRGMEEGHMEADDILCELLRQLGYLEVVEEYEKIGKWYA